MNMTLHCKPRRRLGWAASMRLWVRAFFGLVLAMAAKAADSLPQMGARRLADLSIQELMNESITSVSKKETKLTESPAAVTVITAEDIRRIGATSIPEALRIVPGLDVARINASEWAVSSRGFNNQYANKLLVLVDGRSVYTPSFSGVFWHMQDLMLEDLDRIEVIRGPGATLWGANAVNGVINIMTKSARDTQGLLSSVTYGTDLKPLANLRYGGQLSTNLYYRVYGQFLEHDNFLRSDGPEASDQWNTARGGARLDWHPDERNHLTLQGDYDEEMVHQPFDEAHLTPFVGLESHADRNHNHSVNVLGRWTHTFSATSESMLQLYYDAFKHVDAGSLERRETFDMDWHHRFAVGARNDVVWGLGYRYTPDDISSSTHVAVWDPRRAHDQVLNAFVQDEILLVPDQLSLTLGTKLEHNDYTGFEIQPSARLLWTPTDKQSVWTAVSRATRTPNRFEQGARINTSAFQPPMSPPIEVALLPTSTLQSEELIAYELGYRVQPAKALALDWAAFYNVYQNLHVFTLQPNRFETTPPPPHVLVPVEGFYDNPGDTYGVELQAQWQVTEGWRLAAGYTWLHMRLDHDEATERDNPQHQFHLRSSLDLTHNTELNGVVYYVDKTAHVANNATFTTPAYVRLDLGATWRPLKNLELSIWGQNLLDPRHSEITSFHTAYVTEIPRGVLGKITWRF